MDAERIGGIETGMAILYLRKTWNEEKLKRQYLEKKFRGRIQPVVCEEFIRYTHPES
jgi:hypothetical protein